MSQAADSVLQSRSLWVTENLLKQSLGFVSNVLSHSMNKWNLKHKLRKNVDCRSIEHFLFASMATPSTTNNFNLPTVANTATTHLQSKFRVLLTCCTSGQQVTVWGQSFQSELHEPFLTWKCLVTETSQHIAPVLASHFPIKKHSGRDACTPGAQVLKPLFSEMVEAMVLRHTPLSALLQNAPSPDGRRIE